MSRAKGIKITGVYTDVSEETGQVESTRCTVRIVTGGLLISAPLPTDKSLLGTSGKMHDKLRGNAAGEFLAHFRPDHEQTVSEAIDESLAEQE